MAASGSHHQHPPAAYTNQAPLKTIPPDFRFKTIGQVPGLLRRITTPDPEGPVSPSPSPPASPKPDSIEESIPDNQSQMKPKASLLERITGPSAAPASQGPAAGPSQSIFAAHPTRVNAPADTSQSKAASSKSRSASLKAPSPDDHSITASRVLPKLDAAPGVPPSDSAMDIDTLVNSGPVLGQASPALPRSDNAADETATASSSVTARRSDQPSGGPPLSPYATLRNRLEGISEALLNLPTVNTAEADRLLELAKAQSTAALESANHAQETTRKALECFQEATKAVNDCINAAQESSDRTNAAMAAVAALTGPAYEEERQRFIAPIQAELTECRQAMDQMEELLQRRRQLRAQRQLQSSTQAAPAGASTGAPIAPGPIVESAAAPIVAVPAVAPGETSSTASAVALPAAVSPVISSFATQPNAAGVQSQATRSQSTNGDNQQSLARNGKEKEEIKGLTVDDYLRNIEAESKAFQEEQKRNYEAHQAWLVEEVARVKRMHEGASTAVAQNVQATNGQLNDDHMMVDDEDGVKDLREETRSGVSNEVRQRMIKERLEAERQAVHRRSEEQDKPVEIEVPVIAEERLLQQEEEEGRRRQAIQRRQVQEQKQLAAADEAKNINARRALLKQASPTETAHGPSYLKDESTFQTTEALAEPTTTKPARQTGKVISGNVSLRAVNESLQGKKKADRATADADGDRNIYRVDMKNRTPGQSKPNSVSPIARHNPLPDVDFAMKHTQQVTGQERNHPVSSIAANTIPIPATLRAALPPPSLSSNHQAPLSPTTSNPEVARASSMSRQQVSISSLTNQHASQHVTSLQETQAFVVKRDPDEDEDVKHALWNASAPMTPESLPPDNSTGHSDPSHQVKREGSISIPMLSLPSPPPPVAPTTTSGGVVPQPFGQQHGAVDDPPPEQVQTPHAAPGTRLRNDSNVSNTGGHGQNTHALSPSGSQPSSFTTVSLSYRPPDVAARNSLPIPATHPLSVRPEYRPATPTFVAADYPPSVPSLVVTEGTPAKANADPERRWKQSIPESYSSSSLSSGWKTPPLQRRVGGDHYSPSPPPRRSRSRLSRPMPPRGDHYLPRRNISPGHSYSCGYSRYSADRSRSRGPINATNSRDATPNPYSSVVGRSRSRGPINATNSRDATPNPYSSVVGRSRSRGPIDAKNSRDATPNPYSSVVGYREPPSAQANQGRKRSYAGDMPQGPPPRRPRYDEPLAGTSRFYASGQDMRDERSVISNRAPTPPEYRSRPLEERLQHNAPPDATYNRGRKANYEPNDRYNNRRPFPEDQERYIYDRPPPPHPDRRPPPTNQEIPPPANANEGMQRPALLSRLGNGNGNATHDSDNNSYFHLQPTNNHHNHYNSNRGGPRRGRGTAPPTPRGGKNSLINRIEN